jgi:tetratricopeptide (TPR) repeat protein
MDQRQLFSAALAHHQAGRLAEAEAAYRRVLSVAPDHIDSLHLLGVAATQLGRHEEAIRLIGRAIELKPTPAAQFHSNIGLAYRGQGANAEAIDHFRRAVALKPDYTEAHNNLAAVLIDEQRFAEAEPHCRQAVALRPGAASARFALGLVLQKQNRWAEAEAAYERAVQLPPTYPRAWNNLAIVRMNQGKLDDAAAALREAIGFDADYVEAHYNLGTVHQEQGVYSEALAAYRRATELNPDYVDAHVNEALLHLRHGEFEQGWPKYEWRWRRDSNPPRSFTEPLWDGGDLAGRTILLHAEQGVGDTLQFVRYAPLVKAKGGPTLILECQPALVRLLRSVPGVDRVIPRSDNPTPLFDCHAPLLTLPRLFGTTLDTIPANIPYLGAVADSATVWEKKVGRELDVGLVWRGNPGNSRDRQRSIPAEVIAPVCAVPGINWLSLQIDARPDELEALAQHGVVQDFSAELRDWSATAALISVLDLVITVDTAVAHLAGALGKPVWILLESAPHWCWLTDRTDSPWYPSARLFRQSTRGDWQPVLRQVREELARRAQ